MCTEGPRHADISSRLNLLPLAERYPLAFPFSILKLIRDFQGLAKEKTMLGTPLSAILLARRFD
jgi:hypothetical protein